MRPKHAKTVLCLKNEDIREIRDGWLRWVTDAVSPEKDWKSMNLWWQNWRTVTARARRERLILNAN